MHRSGASRGFSLIEVAISAVVIGILAAMVYPNLREHVAKARRADAQAVLLEAAQFMERFYTENGRYHPPRGGAPASTLLRAWLPEAPKDAGVKYYDIALPAVAQETYRLEAVPKNAQLGDRCGTLTLTNTGETGVYANCWRR